MTIHPSGAFPSFSHRYCARCFQNGYLVRIYHAWSLFLILSMCPSTVRLADTGLHSPTTLAYESITHTSFIDNTHAIYGEAGHAPTCASCLLSFPICLLGSHNITLSHCFFTMTLWIYLASHRRLCRLDTHSLPVSLSQPLAIIFPLSRHHLFVHDGRREQATRRARQSRAQRQQPAVK